MSNACGANPEHCRSLDDAVPLADTVLFEGHVLYPYRANDTKNHVRWQFGVLMPPGFVEQDTSERSYLQTDLLIDGRAQEITVRLRFLHVVARRVERATPDGFTVTDALDVGDTTYLPCDEVAVHETELALPVPPAGEAAREIDVHVDGGIEVEELRDGGRVSGRLVRCREPLTAHLAVTVEPLPGPTAPAGPGCGWTTGPPGPLPDHRA